MENEFHLGDYVAIFKRRYLYFIAPLIIVAGITVALSVFLPPVFQSAGTIVIESPQISGDLIRSAVNSQAAERIDIIKQRVMTRANLLRIVEKIDVFQEKRKGMSTTQIVDEMRDLVGVDLVFARTGPRGRDLKAIAFKVSFDHSWPTIAMGVANELVTLFLNENVKARTASASETTEFLAQETQKLERALETIEEDIAKYKQEFGSSLPEHLNLRLEMRERFQKDIQERDREIKALEEEKRFLDIQLSASRNRTDNILDDAPSARKRSPEEELKYLQSGLLALSADYSASHPDIKKLKRKISAARKKLIDGGGYAGLTLKLQDLENQLKAARALDDPDEAEIKRLASEIDATEKTLAQLPDESKKPVVQEGGDPVSAMINTKLSITDGRIQSLRTEKEELAAKLQDVEVRIIQTPQVERGLKNLNRDYENTQSKYNEIRSKHMEAQLSENLEQERKAERFTLLEPPTLPEAPIKPDRQKILMIGLALSFAAGGAGIFLVEFLDGSVRGIASVTKIVKHEPLATIPYIVTMSEAQNSRKRKIRLGIIATVSVVTVVTLVHVLYMPLDVALYKLLARLDY